ncbi:MAG: glutaredoxin family protein [Planctomycetia bacterium]|nr:glutaredoxin family protein [Planctomycetia bacterium]
MVLSTLLRWWRGSRAALSRLEVILYTRQGCHLCEDAWLELEQLREHFGFELRAVDIDADPALLDAHSERVPVIAVNGKERFWGRVNFVLVRRLLEAEARRSSRRGAAGK